MERAEFPFAVAELFRFNVPDMISFRFCFLSVLVEAQDVMLTPEIIPDLDGVRAGGSINVENRPFSSGSFLPDIRD